MNLTHEQEEVANFDEGGLVLIAAAGTGKTATITERVVRLINKGAVPKKILCITFTNKAAQEMKERISLATGLSQDDLSIFTFHGFCNFWLRQAGRHIGKVNYTIMDAESTTSAIKSVVMNTPLNQSSYEELSTKKDKTDFLSAENKELGKIKLGQASTYIAKIASLGLKNAERQLSKVANLPFCKQVLKYYEEYKLHSNLLDFNDLHKYGIELFRDKLQLNKIYDYLQVKSLTPY